MADRLKYIGHQLIEDVGQIKVFDLAMAEVDDCQIQVP